MRLWSIHPELLDTKGLLAVWREGLLAKKVLEGSTKGYKNHPQLLRFKQHKNPLYAINNYLYGIYNESALRGYNFSKNKLAQNFHHIPKIPVTLGQVNYECILLFDKLTKRSPNKNETNKLLKLRVHDLFYIIDGGVEGWEKIRLTE